MNNKYNDGEEIVDKRTSRRITGDRGEELACEFLMKQGFIIKDRNYLRKYGEIDIVAIKQQKYHYVEVKTVTRENISNVTRDTFNEYRPEDNIHPWKLKRLGRVIQAYILDKHLFSAEWQFDIITVYLELGGEKVVINYIDDIVL